MNVMAAHSPMSFQRQSSTTDAVTCNGMMQVAGQLQALLEEKARLALENARLAA